LLFIATQELNDESGELLDGAPEGLAGEQRAQNRVLGNTRVKLCREPLTTGFTA
jgi:hypothetical protein